MASQVTVTGVVGPGQAITAQVFSNVTSFSLDCPNEVLSLVDSGKIHIISIAAATTITVTVTANVYTVSIS